MGLVLSLKPGESILIGANVRVTLVRMESGRCRLDFDAPREVKILRESICGEGEKETTKDQ